MEKIIPFFELNGKRYEIKRTRYLLAEYDKLTESTDFSKEDKIVAAKMQNLIADIQKYAEKTKELEEKYFEDFDDIAEKKYLKAKALYEKALNEYAELEAETGSSVKLRKQSINILERIAIIGLAEQYEIGTEKATAIWEEYVDSIGKEQAVEWLASMAECLFGNDEEVKDNSFLYQMRKRKENKIANKR